MRPTVEGRTAALMRGMRPTHRNHRSRRTVHAGRMHRHRHRHRRRRRRRKRRCHPQGQPRSRLQQRRNRIAAAAAAAVITIARETPPATSTPAISSARVVSVVASFPLVPSLALRLEQLRCAQQSASRQGSAQHAAKVRRHATAHCTRIHPPERARAPWKGALRPTPNAHERERGRRWWNQPAPISVLLLNSKNISFFDVRSKHICIYIAHTFKQVLTTI